jgi:UrcA family protein
LSRLLTASCAAILALVPTSSQAADKDQKLDFRYEPEEVATADAAATLYERIIALAEAECRMISNPPIINPRSKQCARELVDQLITSINSPLLTAHANDLHLKNGAPETQKGG